MKWFNLFKQNPDVSVETDLVKSIWRNNMWVMTPRGVGVIFALGEPVTVHLTDSNGLTVESVQLPSGQLRQALWDEIPESRRGVSREKGYRLGYN